MQWELLNDSSYMAWQRFALGFATVILVIGLTILIAGVVLAVILYRKQGKGPGGGA